MLKIAICDDDLHFTGALEALTLKESHRLGIRIDTSVFQDGKTLVDNILSGERYHLIFLDIEMNQLDGIAAARQIRSIDRSVLLIYISGHDSYLKELFEVEPFRFLSKPLNTQKFCSYFREACKRIEENDSYFQLSFNKELRRVALKDIAYFESKNRIVYIYLSDGSSEHFYGKLNDVEKSLQDSRLFFLRIHQSFLVNYNYITKINYCNVAICVSSQTIELKISEDRQKDLLRQISRIAEGKAVIE